MDGLGTVEFISDLLLADGLWSLVIIATGYRWIGCAA
jgi:hypothetical protein